MNATTLQRLTRLEVAARESKRKTVRGRITRLIADHGIQLLPESLERIVTASIEREPRIRRMQRAGIPDREIADTLIAEIEAKKGQPCEQG